MTLFNGSIPRQNRHELRGVLSMQQSGDEIMSSDTDCASGSSVGQEPPVDWHHAAQVVPQMLLLLRMSHVERLAPSFTLLRLKFSLDDNKKSSTTNSNKKKRAHRPPVVAVVMASSHSGTTCQWYQCTPQFLGGQLYESTSMLDGHIDGWTVVGSIGCGTHVAWSGRIRSGSILTTSGGFFHCIFPKNWSQGCRFFRTNGMYGINQRLRMKKGFTPTKLLVLQIYNFPGQSPCRRCR